MANYHCTTRTNYFHVKSIEKFKGLIDRTYPIGNIEIYEQKSEDGKSTFCFGCYGTVDGLDINGCLSQDAFYNELQKIVAENDAIIIFEAGAEKLKYVVGDALIITHDDIKRLSIDDLAVKEAGKMLGNPDYTTECNY